nr:MAG TPA: hypothetical protein [Caudoviricetes sp.]
MISLNNTLEAIGNELTALKSSKVMTAKLNAGKTSRANYIPCSLKTNELGITYRSGLFVLPAGRYRITANIASYTANEGRNWVALEQKTPISKSLIGGIGYGEYATINLSIIVDFAQESEIGLWAYNDVDIDKYGTGPSIIQIEKMGGVKRCKFKAFKHFAKLIKMGGVA